MSGQLIFQHQDNIAPHGVMYHGRDQKVTMFARAGVANLSATELCVVIPDGNGWTVSGLYASAGIGSGEVFRVGIILGFRGTRSRVGGEAYRNVVGDLVEVQIGGYARQRRAATGVTPSVGGLLNATTSTPFYSVLAASTDSNRSRSSVWGSIEEVAGTSSGDAFTAIHLFGVDVRT